MKVIEFPRIKGSHRRPKATFYIYTDGTVVGRVSNAPLEYERLELQDALELAKRELKKRINRNKP